MYLSDALSSIEYFYRRIYWQAPTAITIETPNYTLTYSGVTWLHSINHLWLGHIDMLNDILLKETSAFFQQYRAEYSIVFTESEPVAAQYAHWLIERGYIERSGNPIYALHGLPRPRYTHREVRIALAEAHQQQEILDILYGAFFMGPEIGRCAVRPEHFSDPCIRHYLAFIGNESVACATILLDGNIASVWNVGTLRPYRKQGIAAAILMRALADAAADGYRESVLVASPMGRPLYEEMGYQFLGNTLFYGPGE